MEMKRKQSTDPRPSKMLPLLGKVCLICYCCPQDYQRYDFSYGNDVDGIGMNHCLYLLDLDEGEGGTSFDEDSPYHERNPNLCFNAFDLGFVGFCVLRSTLYLFGDEKTVFGDEKTVVSYDLSSLPPSSSEVTVLTLESLSTSDCPPMKFGKRNPLGLQTPDEKMIVFNSVIVARTLPEKNNGDFELFDPEKGMWTELPDPRPLLYSCWKKSVLLVHRNAGPYFAVMSYSFIDNTSVLLINTGIGNFTLDLNELDKGWSKRQEFRYPYPTLSEPYILVRGNVCLAEWFAWEEGKERSEVQYPGLSNIEKRDNLVGIGLGGSTWLPFNFICVSRSYVQESTLFPHVIVDVYRVDDEEDLEKKVEVIKRFKFISGPQDDDENNPFYPRGLFSIPPPRV